MDWYGQFQMFQFHIGAIRSEYFDPVQYINYEFQFHIGAIRSPHGVPRRTRKAEFQFHIGAIRSVNVIQVLRALRCVSIPYWCN